MHRVVKYVFLIIVAQIPISILSVLIPINPQNSIDIGGTTLYVDTYLILWIPVVLILIWFAITDIRDIMKEKNKQDK
jgi:hypothetical protein